MRRSVALLPVLLLIGCSSQPVGDPGVGTQPVLPAPHRSLIPTIDIAPATGWPAGTRPTAAAGLQVKAFASGLQHPRWLHVLPNGDVLVAESNGPAGKSGIRGFKGAVMQAVMKRAGAGTPSADRITLLRDANGDGVAETRDVLLAGLHSPFGMALVGDSLYVANADALVRVTYRRGQTRITATPELVVALPGKGDELNHHWTKSLLAAADGKRLYMGVGSNSNAGENGMQVEAGRAAVLEIDPLARTTRTYASGLRNPVGLAWRPGTQELWAVVNERDELGNNLVPDYLTHVQPGAFYGWPYSYYGQHLDPRVTPPRPDLVATAVAPDYALGNHVAPLGLAFADGAGSLPGFPQGALIGLHGSWNRKPPNGYKVVFVPFVDGRPGGLPRDVLTGFLDPKGRARGRPVGIALRGSALLVADDVGDTVWWVGPAKP